MTERIIKITDSSGLHLRPAGELCQKAMEFDCRVHICFRDKEFNAKSLLSVLSACIHQEDEIRLVCSGVDEEEAADALTAFIEQGTL